MSLDQNSSSAGFGPEITEPLADAHGEWTVKIEEVSGQTLIEAERRRFHPNGSSATALALDHPMDASWEVLAPGNQETRWRARYGTATEAAAALAEITNIFETRQSINCNRPSGWIVRAYYAIETLLLDELKDNAEGNSGQPDKHSGSLRNNR